MKTNVKLGGSALLAALMVLGVAPEAQAYGPEGLFGGRPLPDSTIQTLSPVELRNDRPERAESVLEHPRPDYDPAPIDLGSFELFPTLELGETYDDNIYAAREGQRDDVIGSVRPIVELFSNWGRHAMSFTTYGDVNYYSEHADENYKNGVFALNGRYDIVNQTWLAARGGYQRLTEQRTSPNAVNGSDPTTFGLAKGGLTFFRGPGKLKMNADYDIKRFDYDDTPSSTGMIDQSTRDRDEHLMAVRFGYDWSGNFQPYVRATYNIRNYDNNPTHESKGYEVDVGATADFGGITSLDLYVGWFEQYYDKFTDKKIVTSPKMGGRLDWNVTGLTSVVLEGTRTLEETTQPGFNSFFSTGGSATITHELLRNVLVEGDFAFTRDDFNGVGERQDDQISAGGGFRYLINRNLYTDVMYNWERRYSTDDASKYYRNVGTVRLGVRL